MIQRAHNFHVKCIFIKLLFPVIGLTCLAVWFFRSDNRIIPEPMPRNTDRDLSLAVSGTSVVLERGKQPLNGSSDAVDYQEILDALGADATRAGSQDLASKSSVLLAEMTPHLPSERQQEVQAVILALIKENDVDHSGYLNDLLGGLIYQEHPLRTTGDLLELIARDGKLNPVFRDYAAQAFANWFEVAFREGRPDDAVGGTQYDRMMTTWRGIIAEKADSVSATSLMGMYHQFGNGGDPGAKALVAESAVALVNDPGANELARISAMQVAAGMGDERVLATCRAKSRNGSLLERRSAIAALGRLGDAQDARELRQMMEKSSARDGLAPAFEGAIRLIDERFPDEK